MSVTEMWDTRNSLIMSLCELDDRIRQTFIDAASMDSGGDVDAMELFEDRSRLEELIRDLGAVPWPFSMEDVSWVK